MIFIINKQTNQNISVTLTSHRIFGLNVVQYRLKVFIVVKLTLCS